MSRLMDSTIFRVILAIAVGAIAFMIVDWLFSGVAPAISFAAAVLAGWFLLKR